MNTISLHFTPKLVFKIAMAVVMGLFFAGVFNSFKIGWLLIGSWAGMAVVSFFAINLLGADYNKALVRRINAVSDAKWVIKIDGVEIGSVSDSVYAQFKLDSHGEQDNYGRQLINLVQFVGRVLSASLSFFPAGLFWGLFTLIALYPEVLKGLAEFVVAAQTADLGVVTTTIRVSVNAIGVAFGFFVGIYAFFAVAIGGGQFGFKNYFSASVARQLYLLFPLAPAGRMTLSGWHGKRQVIVVMSDAGGFRAITQM